MAHFMTRSLSSLFSFSADVCEWGARMDTNAGTQVNLDEWWRLMLKNNKDSASVSAWLDAAHEWLEPVTHQIQGKSNALIPIKN